MPEMDGFQFKKELNEISEYREIPFILISSVSDKTSRKLQTELGINEYLEKPFTKNEIISRVLMPSYLTLMKFAYNESPTDKFCCTNSLDDTHLLFSSSGIGKRRKASPSSVLNNKLTRWSASLNSF